MTRVTVEYRQLVDALDDSMPPCRGDWRFVLDEHDLDAGDVTVMKSACRGCPVAGLCARYALTARPSAGMWCGSYYPQRPSRRKERTA